MKDLHNDKNLDMAELLKLTDGSNKAKVIAMLSCCFKELDIPFGEALPIARNLGQNIENAVMSKCYETKYKRFCRREKIKAFFAKLFSKSEKKKQVKEEKKEKNQSVKAKTNAKTKKR